MTDPTIARVIKEALAKYGLDKDSPTVLAARIKEELGFTVAPADIVAMKSRIRQGLERLPPTDPGAVGQGEGG